MKLTDEYKEAARCLETAVSDDAYRSNKQTRRRLEKAWRWLSLCQLTQPTKQRNVPPR